MGPDAFHANYNACLNMVGVMDIGTPEKRKDPVTE